MTPPSTAFERKFEIQPIRRTPRARKLTPATIASAADHSAALSLPSAPAPASGVITAAETAATVALGPWTTWRAVPKIAYAIRAANAV